MQMIMRNSSLETIFALLPRIALEECMRFSCESVDVYLFHWFKERFLRDAQFWIRNNESTQ